MALGLLKVQDMFKFALWKFYFRLMNNKLPTCFEYLKPVLPCRICDNHNIRRPSFHLPLINSGVVGRNAWERRSHLRN